MKIDLDEPARVRQGQDLRVPRHRRAVRPARPARRGRLPVPQRRRRPLHRGRREGRGRRSARATSAWASPGSTRTTTAGPTSTWPTTPRPSFLYLNQKDGTFKESGLPHGRGGERGRRRAGQHGRGPRRLRQQRAASASSSRTSPRSTTRSTATTATHFTDVSFRSKTAASSLPYVGWGTALLRLRQRRLARPHRRQRPRLSRSSTRRGSAPPPATASAGCCTTTAATAPSTRWRRSYGPVLTEERVSRGLAVGDLDDDGRLDVVINDLDGAPQVLRNELADARPLAARASCVGKGRNTDAIGAVVTVKAAGVTQTRARPERDELPLAGRHAPALRPGRARRRRTASRCAGPTAPPPRWPT